MRTRPPPNIGVLRFTRFPLSARSGLVLSLVFLEAFSAFSAFRSALRNAENALSSFCAFS